MRLWPVAGLLTARIVPPKALPVLTAVFWQRFYYSADPASTACRWQHRRGGAATFWSKLAPILREIKRYMAPSFMQSSNFRYARGTNVSGHENNAMAYNYLRSAILEPHTGIWFWQL